MRTALYIFALLLFFSFMNQAFTLRKYIESGKRVRMLFIFPIKLRDSELSKSDFIRVRFWRMILLLSFIGLIVSFILLSHQSE